jgi:hypothetical protein
MIDVALREAESAFQVRGRQHLPCEDELLETGHAFFEDAEDSVGERFGLLFPIARAEIVRSVLDQGGKDVLARRCEPRFHDRRDEDLE